MSRTARVKGIAQTITKQVDTQDDEHDEEAGENPHPPRATDEERLRLLHHVAPRGSGLLHAESKEGYIGFRENGARQTQRRGHDDRDEASR